MKFLTIVLSIFAFTSEIQSQNLDSIDLNSFVVLYTTGAHWDKEKPPQDQTYFKEHSAHLSALRKSKRITIGGRYDATGMVVLKALNESETNSIIRSDSAIIHKLFHVEIFPFSAFYKGCVE